MRTLLVGEGVHELGDNENTGALAMLVGRLAQTVRIDAARPWKDRSLARLHGTGNGFYKRALRWMIRARKEGFDALVLLVDEDGDRSRFQQLTEAQEALDPEVPRALGVAVRTFDAWMLADETALTGVLGRRVQTSHIPATRDPAAELDRLGDAIAELSAHLEAATARLLDLIRDSFPRRHPPRRIQRLLRPPIRQDSRWSTRVKDPRGPKTS